jgi:hypothetical protein
VEFSTSVPQKSLFSILTSERSRQLNDSPTENASSISTQSCIIASTGFRIGPSTIAFTRTHHGGASNGGESVNVFIERGIEAIHGVGEGMIVIADDDELDWPKIVLSNVQAFGAARGFYVSRMQRKLHSYHLDDAPDLKSCNLFMSSLPANQMTRNASKPIDAGRLVNFYGRSQAPRVKYVRERKKPDYGKAPDEEYTLELLGDAQ